MIYINTLSPELRRRQKVLEYSAWALSGVMRFKYEPYMLPSQRETVQQHIETIKRENAARIQACVKDQKLQSSLIEKHDLYADIHDIGELFDEHTPFQMETDPEIMRQLTGFSKYEENAARFGLELAYRCAVEDKDQLFQKIVTEGRKTCIPEAFYTRPLTPQETIVCYQKLTDFFEHHKTFTFPLLGKRSHSAVQLEVQSMMRLYDEVENKRNFSGALVKMDEKRLGNQYAVEKFHEKKIIEKTCPVTEQTADLRYAPHHYSFRSVGRFETIIPVLVKKLEANLPLAPLVVETIRDAYKTAAAQFAFKPITTLDHAEIELNEQSNPEEHLRFEESLYQKYKEQKSMLQGRVKTILTQENIAAEYKWATGLLDQGKIVVPYQYDARKNKIPSTLLQRHGFDVFRVS